MLSDIRGPLAVRLCESTTTAVVGGARPGLDRFQYTRGCEFEKRPPEEWLIRQRLACLPPQARVLAAGPSSLHSSKAGFFFRLEPRNTRNFLEMVELT
jgi:hypothetical protein